MRIKSPQFIGQDFKERLTRIIGHEKPYVWARRIGLPSATFARIWNEGVPPKTETLLRITEKTGVSVDWLLTGHQPVYRYDHLAEPLPDKQPEGKSRPAEGEGNELSLVQCVEILDRIYQSKNVGLLRAISCNLLVCNEIIACQLAAEEAVQRSKELELKMSNLEQRLRRLIRPPSPDH